MLDDDLELPKRKDEASIFQSNKLNDPAVPTPSAETTIPLREPSNPSDVNNAPPIPNDTATESNDKNPGLSDIPTFGAMPPLGELPSEANAELKPILSEAPTNLSSNEGSATPHNEAGTITSPSLETITEDIVKKPVINPVKAPIPSIKPQKTTTPPPKDEQSDKKDIYTDKKKRSDPVISFLTIIIILAIIVIACYYFYSQGHVDLPFGKTTTTTTTTTTTRALEQNEPTPLAIFGLYAETEQSVCPDKSIMLILNEDGSFTFNNLKYNTTTKKCTAINSEGTYVALDGVLNLTTNDDTEIVGTYEATPNYVLIVVPSSNNNNVQLYKSAI